MPRCLCSSMEKTLEWFVGWSLDSIETPNKQIFGEVPRCIDFCCVTQNLKQKTSIKQLYQMFLQNKSHSIACVWTLAPKTGWNIKPLLVLFGFGFNFNFCFCCSSFFFVSKQWEKFRKLHENRNPFFEPREFSTSYDWMFSLYVIDDT